MIDAQAVREIIAQYEKHGWKLRRALLSSEAGDDVIQMFAGAEVMESDLNALWFSRRSTLDREAWELRRLTVLPFALLTGVSTTATDEELDVALLEIEDELRERTFA